MRIEIVTGAPDGAPFRLRMAPIVRWLREQGHAVDVHVRPRQGFALRQVDAVAREADRIIIHRRLLEPREARRFAAAGKSIYLDLDDAIMFDAEQRSRLSLWKRRRRLAATAGILAGVVAGNDYLLDFFKSRGVDGVVSPTSVEPGDYIVKRHKPTAAPTLVWIGSSSTMKYLEGLLPAIEAAAAKVSGLRLLAICDRPVKSTPIPVENVTWSLETEAASLARGDIGIAPLPEDRWTLGKCAFKIVQYLATGLPVIASPVGPQREMATVANGFLAQSNEQWVTAIERLAGDASLRAQMGAASRVLAERSYSVRAVCDVWAKTLGLNQPAAIER
jgi:glycosyltransferase involved in cell wall biosynthesis